MSSSFLISNPELNSDQSSREAKPKRKRKAIGPSDDSTTSQQLKTNQTRWKTLNEQQIYSSKLINALQQVRRNSAASSSGGGVVRETADRVLAVTAKGRTRWSRAILTNRIKLKMSMMKNKHKKCKKVKITGDILKPLPEKKLPVLQKKVRVLGKLVPGCRKLSFPNLLEETTDYIAALEMQVKAMAALASLLTGAGVSLTAPSTPLESNLS